MKTEKKDWLKKWSTRILRAVEFIFLHDALVMVTKARLLKLIDCSQERTLQNPQFVSTGPLFKLFGVWDTDNGQDYVFVGAGGILCFLPNFARNLTDSKEQLSILKFILKI